MTHKYSKPDAVTFWHWLNHKQWTEMNAFHPAYKLGNQYFTENLKNKTLPQIRYVKNEKDYINFIERFAGTHTVCTGLNPRPSILRNKQNYHQAAKESSITLVQNMLIADIDFIDKKYLDEKMASLELLYPLFDEYFLDIGFTYPPAKASTGQGAHLLAAISPICVENYPDIALRTKAVQDNFRAEHTKDLQELGAKVDSLFDNRRVVKTYGSYKSNVGRMSYFHGGQRQEDDGLRKHLLEMKLPELSAKSLDTRASEGSPPLFQHLLTVDPRLRELYRGNGKYAGQDTSRSGIDFCIVKHLLKINYSNLDDLMQVLRTRPNGAVKGSGKGEQYIRHTIANALKK